MQPLIDSCSDFSLQGYENHYLVPTEMNPPYSGALFPIDPSHTWKSLETTARSLGVTGGILCTFPLIWQLEPLVHKSAVALQVPLAVTSPQNLPLLVPYVERGGIDLIIAEPTSLQEILTLLEKTETKPKGIVVVHHSADTLSTVASSVPLVSEIHLVPGVVLATHSPDQPGFIRSDTFTWTTDENGRTQIHTDSLGPIEINLTLPFSMIQSGAGVYEIHP